MMLTSPFDEGLGGDRAAAGAGPRRRQAEEGREEKGKLISIFNLMVQAINIILFFHPIFYVAISHFLRIKSFEQISNSN